MARVFVTGSTDGLGLAAARSLASDGHEVVLHARSLERAQSNIDKNGGSPSFVIGDLSDATAVRAIADQVNEIGRMDAVIHNAGIYLEHGRGNTIEGHAKTLAVNTLAPYMLTALIKRPDRLVYLGSGMHRSAGGSLADIDWIEREWHATTAYCESKLHVATLAAAVARLWPTTLSNSVDPGWVPTKMGGPGATDNLAMGHETQNWLAVSDDQQAEFSGGYWYHRTRQPAAPAATDTVFPDRLLDKLVHMTGVPLRKGT